MQWVSLHLRAKWKYCEWDSAGLNSSHCSQMSSNGHLLILVQLASCIYKSLRGDKQQLNHRERERKQSLLKKLILGNTRKPSFYCMCNIISYRIQVACIKVENTDCLSILRGDRAWYDFHSSRPQCLCYCGGKTYGWSLKQTEYKQRSVLHWWTVSCMWIYGATGIQRWLAQLVFLLWTL